MKKEIKLLELKIMLHTILIIITAVITKLITYLFIFFINIL